MAGKKQAQQERAGSGAEKREMLDVESPDERDARIGAFCTFGRYPALSRVSGKAR